MSSLSPLFRAASRAFASTALLAGLTLAFAPAAHAADEATAFTLRDIGGQEFKLDEQRGKVIVLSFWATWCGPCKEEMPHLQRLYTEHKDDGLVVVSISSDDARTASRVKPYIMSKGFNFPVVLDKDSKVTSVYNPQKTLPWTVVIDRRFKVAKVTSGYNPGDEKLLETLVKELLAASAE